MTRHTWLTVLLAGALLTSAALAQPTTPPADEAATRSVDAPTDHPGRQPGRPRATRDAGLTAEQEFELLEALGSRFPHRREELLQLKQDKPDLYPHVLGRLWHWYEEWQRLPDDAKEFAMTEQELKIQAIKLARQWQEADPKDRGPIEEQLRDVLRRKFDVSQRLREVRLAAMQRQIEQLRRENAERAEKRAEIIEEQLTRALTSPHGSRGRPSGDHNDATDDTPQTPPPSDNDE